MNTDEFARFLHTLIPISNPMGVAVVEASPRRVTLRAPLAPNVNHQGTVFGGSASAVGLMAAWGVLHLRLADAQLDGGIVVKKYTMTYRLPMPTDFTVTSTIDDAADWKTFLDAFGGRGHGRISVGATITCNGEDTASLDGEFVVRGGAMKKR